jgi:hypothetical protein
MDNHIITLNGKQKEVPWYIEVRHCDYCNKDFEHNGYERDRKIHYVKEDKMLQCCDDCFKKMLVENVYDGKITFVNHIPAFVDGGTYIHDVFDTVDELIKFLSDKHSDSGVLSCDRDYILNVYKADDEIHWWVLGRANVDMSCHLPYWENVVENFKKKGFKVR